VPIETISKFLGHNSTIETLKYLGINLDDMDEGMSLLAQYDNKTLSKRGSK
jgi:integrase/recombinase XerD